MARASILLVEDHHDCAELLARLLEVRGYQVATANTAREALQLSANERFDLVVSDLELPDATGYELIAQLRENGLVRAIAMSGWARPQDIARSREAGFDDHLAKPVVMNVLEQAIVRVMATG